MHRSFGRNRRRGYRQGLREGGETGWGLAGDEVMLMTQTQVNARMQRWGDREILRFTFRAGLFQRRGLTKDEAERMADRLALRDQEKDGRRICLECRHLQQTGGCFAAQQGWLPNTSSGHQPVRDLLQRCEQFAFVTP